MSIHLFNTTNEAQKLISKACKLTGFTEDELISGRNHRFSMIRSVLYYILREQGATFQEIAKSIGNVHYTTVISGTKKIRDLMEIDREVKQIYTELHYGNTDH